MKSDVKIQINSLEALERLLGKDPEFEMEIRRNVGNVFLKNLIGTDKIPDAIKNTVNTMFVESVKSGYSYIDVLTPEAKSLIKKEFELKADDYLRILVVEIFKSTGIYNLVEQKAKWVADTLVDKVLDERFNAQVEMEIKKRLGIK